MNRPKKLPFEGTDVDPDRTKVEISKLLKSFGIDSYQWTEDRGMTELRFLTDIELTDPGTGEKRVRELKVMIRPPLIFKQRRVYDEKLAGGRGGLVSKDVPNYAQSYRILLSHLKNKLTAVAIGMVRFEEEFLADIVVQTREGEKRLGDIAHERIVFLLTDRSGESAPIDVTPERSE